MVFGFGYDLESNWGFCYFSLSFFPIKIRSNCGCGGGLESNWGFSLPFVFIPEVELYWDFEFFFGSLFWGCGIELESNWEESNWGSCSFFISVFDVELESNWGSCSPLLTVFWFGFGWVFGGLLAEYFTFSPSYFSSSFLNSTDSSFCWILFRVD